MTITVQRWSGREVRALREARRMSIRDFAGHLGVSERMISKWEAGAEEITPRPVNQSALDTSLASSSPEAQARFADNLTLTPQSRPTQESTMAQLAVPDEGEQRLDTGPAAGTSQREWLNIRQSLRRHRGKLTQSVSNLYSADIRLGNTGILIPRSWRLPKPVDLSEVRLQWQDDTPRPTITGAEREARRLRPLTTTRDYTKYHRAIRDLSPPRLFENRLTYRLLDVRMGRKYGSHNAPNLTLGEMCYFDMIDVGEALAHEVSLVGMDMHGRARDTAICWENLPFRRLIRDPFELSAYPLMLSVSTLTIRTSRAGSTFFLLRRNPAKVAIAGGMLSVIPTGVFQPASVLRAPHSPDFDLWRNVMREYSEEFLGNPEHDGDGPPIDYDSEEPFKTLDAARKEGRVKISCLGIGIDALNYVGDVLTVAVFDGDLFDSVFAGMVEENDEGEVDTEELTFDEATIHNLLISNSLAPSGAASLHLAWEHRDSLLQPNT